MPAGIAVNARQNVDGRAGSRRGSPFSQRVSPDEIEGGILHRLGTPAGETGKASNPSELCGLHPVQGPLPRLITVGLPKESGELAGDAPGNHPPAAGQLVSPIFCGVGAIC